MRTHGMKTDEMNLFKWNWCFGLHLQSERSLLKREHKSDDFPVFLLLRFRNKPGLWMTILMQLPHMWHVAGYIRSKSKVVWRKRFRLWRQNEKQRLSRSCCVKRGNSIVWQPCASSADSCGLEKCFKTLCLILLQIPWQKFIRRKVTKQSLFGTK